MGPAEEAEELAEDQQIVQCRVAHADEAEAEGCPLLPHLAGDFAACGHRDVQRRARIVAMELHQCPVEDRRDHVTGDGDRHVPGHVVADPAHQLRQLGDGAEDFDCLLVEKLANLRQVEARCIPFDQPASHPVLQPFQRIADARLFQVQPLGRTRDAFDFRDHYEGAQQVPVELPDEPFRSRCYHS
ncbi:hypothetical protein D3C87_1634140 [compost metagenome]